MSTLLSKYSLLVLGGLLVLGCIVVYQCSPLIEFSKNGWRTSTALQTNQQILEDHLQPGEAFWYTFSRPPKSHILGQHLKTAKASGDIIALSDVGRAPSLQPTDESSLVVYTFQPAEVAWSSLLRNEDVVRICAEDTNTNGTLPMICEGPLFVVAVHTATIEGEHAWCILRIPNNTLETIGRVLNSESRYLIVIGSA